MALVTISRSFNVAEADLIRMHLAAADIQAVVTHELATAVLGSAISTGGILVQVAEEDAAAARELLDAPPAEPGSAANQ